MLTSDQIVLGATLVTGLVLFWLHFRWRNRPDLFWYLLPVASFRVPLTGPPPSTFPINSQTLVLQNVGKKPVEECEVVLSRRVQPHELRIEPARRVDDAALPNGEHSYRLGGLGRGEAVVLSFLFNQEAPLLIQIRHREGLVVQQPLNIQRRLPNLAVFSAVVLMFVGVFVVAFLVLLGISNCAPAIAKFISDWLSGSTPKIV